VELEFWWLIKISGFIPTKGLDQFVGYFNITFQPLTRALTAF
jgi:hypothetical protein